MIQTIFQTTEKGQISRNILSASQLEHFNFHVSYVLFALRENFNLLLPIGICNLAQLQLLLQEI